MNIKSLLLGSAAALVAVSGARAADAVDVVAEPEPMEYVRVCDTYGTGYFYVPGTETCLRIGGYVRYDIYAGDLLGETRTDHLDGTSSDTYGKNARLSLRTWTGTETELGTLSTFTETRFNYSNTSNNVGRVDGSNFSLNFAWIQLGGFRVGKDESAFVTFNGYAGNVIQDDLIGFGPFDTNLISYAFDAGNGLSAIVSFEEGSNGTANAGHDWTIDSYVPHIVAGVKYAGGWGGASLVGGYDSVHEQYALKGRLDVNVNEQLSLFAMAGYKTYDNSADAVAVGEEGRNYYGNWAGSWAVWAGGSYKASEKATVNLQVSYAEGYDDLTTATRNSDGQLAVAANVEYELVKGFKITPEVDYYDDGIDGIWGGVLRFQRNF